MNVTTMARNRVLVQFPPEVIADIDKIAGPGKRTSYLVALASRDVKLQQQREALGTAKGAWKDQDHPELADGAAKWIREVRDLDRERFEELERHRDSIK